MNTETNNQWMIHIIALLITLGFFGCFWMMCFSEISDTKREITNIMVGFLGNSFAGVIYYYFGSSAGSRFKDNVLSKKGGSNE